MIKLSIIIPAYNSSDTIKECLDSILENKSKDYEIIVVNDGSTDNTKDILNKYTKTGKIKLVEQENLGASRARNAGLNHANGIYIMFVDADDMLSKDWGKCINFIANDDIYYFSKRLKKYYSKQELINAITGNNTENLCIAGPVSKLFRKAFLTSKRIQFDGDLINGEDMLFNIEAVTRATTYAVINDSFYMYRHRVGSATRSFDKRIINSDKKFHEKLEKLLQSSSMTDQEKKSIKDFCLTSALPTIIGRISYIDKYKEAKKYFKELNEEPYTLAQNSNKEPIGTKNKVIIMLHRMKMHRLLYVIYRIKHSLHNITKGNNNERFETI